MYFVHKIQDTRNAIDRFVFLEQLISLTSICLWMNKQKFWKNEKKHETKQTASQKMAQQMYK